MNTRTVTSLPYTELPTPPAVLPDTNYGDGSAPYTRLPVDRIVIHTMVGTVGSANGRFCSYGTQVSAHYGIGEDGKIYHWLEENLVAYHAGDLTMNRRSIGIEHEDMGRYNDPRPDALYTASAKLVADICKFYGIPCDRAHIIKHNEVIATGCPDALDVDRIVRGAYAILHPQITSDPLIAITTGVKTNVNSSQNDDQFKTWFISFVQGIKSSDLRNWLGKLLGVR